MACSSEYDDWCFFRGSGGMHGKIRVDIIGAGFLYAALMLLIDGVPGAKEGTSCLAAQGILWGVVLACLCSVAFWLRRKKSPSFVEGREFA